LSLKRRFGADHHDMVIDMNDASLTTLVQLREFLAGTADVVFTSPADDGARYRFMAGVLRRFDYPTLARPDKGLLRCYLARTTGYSRAQLTRLIRQHDQYGGLSRRYAAPKAGFRRRYTAEDVALLAEVDSLHGTLSGPTTRALLERALRLYGDQRFARLAAISVAHLYNLRQLTAYQRVRRHWTKTRPTPVRIGLRKPPQPDGRPGFIRIDSVHQGDQDGFKGLYHLDAVDCVTQWQLLATVERISEAYLLPALQSLLDGFPFQILGFHADNGSEYINHTVAKLLNKLKIELTRSRPRHSNDNALVETKNGAVVRTHLGYAHLPQRFATEVNAFCDEHLNPYLNFHRPCFFAVDEVDAKGKIRKRYPPDQIMTPWDRLRSIPNVATALKPGVTLETLQHQASQMSDNEAAQRLNTARTTLFQSIHRRSRTAA
jgi:transposase InsO family protein